MRIVGISLVRNEDRFIRRALLNVADFCDQLLVADHQSTDRTADVLRELSGELDHLETVRVAHSAQSHALVQELAGSDVWVLSVDGDELYDPSGLRAFRAELEAGAFTDVFRVRPAALHCDRLDIDSRAAWGYLSPPGRPVLGIFNFAAIESWTNVRSQRLHGGDVVFRSGFDWDSWRHLGADLGWEHSPFRDLHVCFVHRSSRDRDSAAGRPNLSETRRYRRRALGSLEQLVRRAAGRDPARKLDASDWKTEKYRRGARVRVDASAFLDRV